MNKTVFASMAAALLSAGSCLAGLTFNYTNGPNLAALAGSNPALYNSVHNGFVAGGSLWSAQFTDNITVNLTINYAALGAGILGSTGSTSDVYTYSDVRAALNGDKTSAADITAVASLPVGSTFGFYTNDRTGTKYLANGAANFNSYLDVNSANAKAIGLLAGNSAGEDASITFSSLFSWDFDRTNGISGSAYDFIGVAAHEIGHALGFVNGVDTVDYYSGPNGPGKNIDINGGAAGIGTLADYAVFSALDFYRFSGTSGAYRDLAYGDTPFFSINDGTTNLGTFSTGSYNGDGRQASHWKDNLGLGIMDPTAGLGELLTITPLDIKAMDVIGFDLPIPEPATVGLFLALGLMGIPARRRRR